MMDTDDLAAELGFNLGPSPKKTIPSVAPPKIRSGFDDDDSSSDNDEAAAGGGGGGGKPNNGDRNTVKKGGGGGGGFDDSGDDAPVLNASPSASQAKEKKKKSSGNKWDDTDSEDDETSATPASRGGGAGGGANNRPSVKFPSLPEGVQLIQLCTREATLSNVARGHGPCPYIRCEQCGYLVVKCGQGAEWHDEKGTVDLYLEMRYFYPDWSRYQSSTISPVTPGGPDSPAAAAYGCQCTWFTCYENNFPIKTPLGAKAFNVQEDGGGTSGNPKKGGKFVSSSRQYRELEKAVSPGGSVVKPLPRWICCGHPPLK